MLTKAQIDAAVDAFPEINFESGHGRAQRRIIDHLAASGRLSVAIGVAGSGKSTLLKPLVRAWQADGRTVHGIALAWRQSDELQDAGIPAQDTRAVESLLRGLARGRLHLGPKAVVVIDEIGLLGTRQLNEILLAREQQGFQLVAIGDPKQMQAVEAGPVIDLLCRALGDRVPELMSSVRQTRPEERETVLMLRNSQTEDAIHRKWADGTLKIIPGGYEEGVAAVVALWETRRNENRERAGYSLTLSAPTNFDAHNLSVAIRRRRRELEEVGQDRMTVRASDAGGAEARVFDLPLAVGDRVRLFQRTSAKNRLNPLGVSIGRNGSVLEIREISEAGLTLRAASGTEGLVVWSNLRDRVSEHILLDYGEVLTTNTAQGSTVTDHIHAIPGGSRSVSAFGAYTSGSRHRDRNWLVVSDGAERTEVAARRPLGDRREILVEDVLANIIRNLSREPRKESSLELLERADDLRRGSIRNFQGAAESAQRSSGSSGSFARRLEEGRLRERLDGALPAWATRLKARAQDVGRAARTTLQTVQQIVEAVRKRKARQARYWRDVADDAPAQSQNRSPRTDEAARQTRKL
jgi:ATP-dependent exoDNAse (exonuclease V) alpha subunit